MACVKWAKANNHKLVAVLKDEGISGTKDLPDRPALADALRLVKEGHVKGVVVYRLDRLARDLVIQEQLLAEVRRLGGTLFTTSAGEAHYLEDDPSDPSRTLIRQVLGAVGQYERAMISLRLRSGRRAKADRGGFAYGSPALGFKAENGSLVPVEDEQAVIDRIAALRGAGASLRTICNTLTAEGHPTKRGTRWHPNTVARVLDRRGDKAPLTAQSA